MLKGLDKLSRELKDAQGALSAIDGEIGRVSFDPVDPESIELAIQQVVDMINQSLGDYVSNPFIAPIVEEMKEKYRDAILDRAAEARLGGDEE